MNQLSFKSICAVIGRVTRNVYIVASVSLFLMAKRSSVNLPSGQGGLIGGVSSSYKTKYEFGPKVVVYFSLVVVFFIWILFTTLNT